MSSSGSRQASRRATRGASRTRCRRRAPRARRACALPDGLPLGKPPLALSGIASRARPPVTPRFHRTRRARAMLFNLDTGQVLWARNPYIAPAHREPDEDDDRAAHRQVRARPTHPCSSPARRSTRPARRSACCRSARHVRLESMLYGLLLPSGNDAAVALAQHVAGSVNRFVARMNAEAAQLGPRLHPLLLAVGLLRPGQLHLRRRPRGCSPTWTSRSRGSRASRAPTPPVLPFPIKGGKLYLYNNNPLLIYGYPGADGPEDRLHRSGRTLPRRDRRAPRRAPGRRAAALARARHAGQRAARHRASRTSTTSRCGPSRRSRAGA